MREARMRRAIIAEDGNMGADFPMTENAVDFEDVKGNLSIWVKRPEVERWIRRNFGNFLRTYTDENG
jgi:phage baseplate assembly protein W